MFFVEFLYEFEYLNFLFILTVYVFPYRIEEKIEKYFLVLMTTIGGILKAPPTLYLQWQLQYQQKRRRIIIRFFEKSL